MSLKVRLPCRMGRKSNSLYLLHSQVKRRSRLSLVMCGETLPNSLHKCCESCGAGTDIRGRWNGQNGMASGHGWNFRAAPASGRDECGLCETEVWLCPVSGLERFLPL